MLRMRHWEGAKSGISWAHLQRELENAERSTVYLVRKVRMRSWLDSHIPTVVNGAAEKAEQLGIRLADARKELTGMAIGPLTRESFEKYRRHTQRWTSSKLLQAQHFDPVERLRTRMCRWDLPGLPGRVFRRVHLNLQRLRLLVTPRTAAAVFSTLLNRWVTARRMRTLDGRSGSCLFGCTAENMDSIEHYLRCPIFRAWYQRRLPYAGFIPQPQDFLLATNLSNSQLQLLAVTVYVAYRTTNHLRHRSDCSDEYKRHFMDQVFHEAVRGKVGLCRVVDGKRARSPRPAAAGPRERRVRRRMEA